jgi:hypothetical protein
LSYFLLNLLQNTIYTLGAGNSASPIEKVTIIG